MFYGQNELMKFFLAKSTASYGGSESAWLACFRSGTWASQEDLEPPSEAVDLAAILDYLSVGYGDNLTRSPSKSE